MDREDLRQRVVALIEQTQGVAFIVPEDTGYFSIEDDLVREARSLIERTGDLMGDLMRFYDAESVAHGESEEEDDDGGFLKEIGAQISSELAAREVSNLAFVARGQLVEMQEALIAALEKQQVWAVASHADSGLRHAGKALIAAEIAICEYEGLPAPDRHWVDLEVSLETRRLYAQFRRAILRSGEAKAGDALAAQLRSAATRIRVLRNLESYPFLRIDDRLTIKELARRIASWLNGEGDAGDQAGQRLWADLVSFARLLVKVNDREELREHDRKALQTLYRMLFSSKRSLERLAEPHLKELEKLAGRDDALDQLILRVDEHRVSDFREPIEKLLNQLQRPFTSQPTSFSSSLLSD